MSLVNTDKVSSVAAAVQAGKLPSQKQTNDYISLAQRFLQNANSQAASLTDKSGGSDVGKLSEHGSTLVRDLIEILEAYKQIGNEKNGDDVVQEGIWGLTQSEAKVDVQSNIETPEAIASRDEVKTDARAVSDAFQNLFDVFVGNLGGETSPILAELLSFFRLSLADVAETVESGARQTKEKLRDVDEEVQEGHRDAVGRTKVDRDNQEGQQEGGETRAKFEQRMDTAKGIGLTAIDVGQQTKQTAQEYTEISRAKLLDALDNIIRRAQEDPHYGDSINTISKIVEKWLNKSLDYADQTSEAGKQSSLDGIVDDPTGQLQRSLDNFNIFIERCAGGKSTQNIKSAFNTFGQDVRANSEVRQLFSDANAFLRKSLQDEEFVQSDAFDQQKADLSQRWRSILNAETPESRKLKENTQNLQQELEAFQVALKEDKDLQRLAAAYQQFGKDTAKATAEGAKMSQTTIPWMWMDALNVYLPLVLEYVKGIPIPRTEYKDADVEFVVEDLSLESLRLLPGHAHLSTTLNVDIDKKSGSTEAVTDLSTRSTIDIKGVSMTLKEASFWYNDPSLSLASNLTGLMDIAIPPNGVEAHVTFGLIPTQSGSARRQRRGRFHEIKDVQVKISPSTTINLKKTNHQVIATVFKSMVRQRILTQIENILAEQIRLALETADGIAYDVYRRSGVFADAGLTATGPKYAAAIMSELGELRKHPGILTGWTLTSVGVVKDDPRDDKVFAIGAGPQVISGDHHGPRTESSSIHNTLNEAVTQAQQAAPGSQKGQGYQGGVTTAKGVAQDVKASAAETTQAATAKAKSFKETVDAKAAEEKKQGGWRSSAYDLEA